MNDDELAGQLRRLSHDLRTPLSHIVGAFEMIDLNAHKPAEVARWASVGRDAAERLRTMLDELNHPPSNSGDKP